MIKLSIPTEDQMWEEYKDQLTTNGELDQEKVMHEMFHLYKLVEAYAQVMNTLTEGQMRDPDTPPEFVIGSIRALVSQEETWTIYQMLLGSVNQMPESAQEPLSALLSIVEDRIV